MDGVVDVGADRSVGLFGLVSGDDNLGWYAVVLKQLARVRVHCYRLVE